MLVPLVVRFYEGNVGAATAFVGVAGTLFALMQFVWSPVLGVLSDRFGRKPVLVISGIGTSLDYAFMALAPSAGWLLAGRSIAGMTSASEGTATAYVADITPAERRGAAFGLLGAAFGIGFIVGPAIGGALGLLGERVPFWVAAALCAMNAAFGAFIVPESLARANRATRIAWSKANPLGSLQLLRSQPQLRQLAAIEFVSELGGMVLQTTWVLYVVYRYHWTPAATGASLAIVGVCAIVVQAVLTGRFIARFGERAAIVTGIAFGAASLAVFGIAPSGTVFAAAILPMCLWGLAQPAIASLMSGRVGASQQGELQGAVASLRGLATLAAPGIFTAAFALGIRPGVGVPGAAWFFAAMLLAAALALSLRLPRERVSSPG